MTEGSVQDEEVAARLRKVRGEVRDQVVASFPVGAHQPTEAGRLYGDADMQSLPQLRQHLDELAALCHVREQPFRSRIPLFGPLIAWFRERWNSVSTKWYVRPLLEQQIRFNATAVQVLEDFCRYSQVSSLDLVQRTDTMFRALHQEATALAARFGDLQATVRELEGALQELVERLSEKSAGTAARQDAALSSSLGQEIAQLEKQLQQIVLQQQIEGRELALLQGKLDRLADLAAKLENTPAAE